MNFKILYTVGTVLLFLGLLWMFLPHASHALILNEKEETSHFLHIFEGLIAVVIGVTILIKTEKKIKTNL